MKFFVGDFSHHLVENYTTSSERTAHFLHVFCRIPGVKRYTMEMEWRSLDTDSLKNLYYQKQQELSEELINGADWKDVQAQRQLVTELAIALHKRLHATNPAELDFRGFNTKRKR